jgi:hypothetical protein
MTEAAPADEAMEISPDESRPAAEGSADNFTGNVSVKPLFNPNSVPYLQLGRSHVSMRARALPGTRNSAGQTLIVTTGTGWIQQWGGQEAVDQTGGRDLDSARRQTLARAPPTAAPCPTSRSRTASTASPSTGSKHVTDEQYLQNS